MSATLVPLDGDEDVLYVRHKQHEKCVAEAPFSNIVLAIFTTSYARAKLYSFIEEAETNRAQLLYGECSGGGSLLQITHLQPTQTRCLCATRVRRCQSPLATTSVTWRSRSPTKSLRSLSVAVSELNGHQIHPKQARKAHLAHAKHAPNVRQVDTAPTLAGCKQYGLQMRHKETGELTHEVKLRGITLDHNTCKSINYATFKRLCQTQLDERTALATTYKQLRPSISGGVTTHHTRKTYLPIYQKGYVDGDIVYPYGYSPPRSM